MECQLARQGSSAPAYGSSGSPTSRSTAGLGPRVAAKWLYNLGSPFVHLHLQQPSKCIFQDDLDNAYPTCGLRRPAGLHTKPIWVVQLLAYVLPAFYPTPPRRCATSTVYMCRRHMRGIQKLHQLVADPDTLMTPAGNAR